MDTQELIEAQARALCAERHWEWHCLLRLNERKQTVSAKVRLPTGNYGVVKWIAGTASPTAQAEFQLEARVYVEQRLALTPRLLVRGPDFFVVEYVKGTTLRGAVGANGMTLDHLQVHFQAIADSLASERTIVPDTGVLDASKVLGQRVRTLLTSGPFDVPRDALPRRAAVSFARVGIPTLRRVVSPMFRAWQRRGVRFGSRFGHNDLHADNVLVGTDQAWIIDYERATSPGYWCIDLLFLFATLHATLRAASAREAWRRFVTQQLLSYEPEMQPELEYLVRVFAGAGLSNHQFRESSWGQADNVRSMLALLAPNSLRWR